MFRDGCVCMCMYPSHACDLRECSRRNLKEVKWENLSGHWQGPMKRVKVKPEVTKKEF